MSYNHAHDTHIALQRKLKEKIKEVLEIEHKGRSLSVDEIHLPEFDGTEDLKAEKAAKIQSLSYAEPLKATLTLREDGKIINRAKIKIMDLPRVTKRGSYIINGSEYSTPMQKRLIPGVYVQEKSDGTIQGWMNSGKGLNLTVILREGGDFVLKTGTSQVNLLAFLLGMGLSIQQIRKAWGTEVYNTNKEARGAQDPLAALKKFYGKAKYPSDDPVLSDDIPGYRKWISDYFDNKSEFDPDNVKITIGSKHSKNGPGLMLETSKSILAVSRGDKEEDNRESLIHNHIFDLSDFILERMNQRQYKYKIERTIRRNLGRYNKVADIYQKNLLQDPVESTFTQTSLTRIPKQTNPMDIMSSFSEITVTGEGGIRDMHAIQADTRAIDPSHLGFIDLAHTPEGMGVGVNLHVTNGVKKKGKNLVNTFYDVKTGKDKELNPRQVYSSYVIFAENFKNGKVKPDKDGKVKATYQGEIQKINPSKAQYAMRTTTDMFDMNVMAIPFLSNNNGVRVMTASKMQTQAKPLKNREKPLIMCAESEKTKHTVEETMGRNESDRSPVSGTVKSVGKDKIVITDSKGKDHKVDIAHDFWMNDNNYISAEPVVKKGDKVKKGDLLADTNYTKDGTLALGTNLRTAYISYKGLNHEDGVVISESCAEKLTSLHAHQKSCPINDSEVIDKNKYMTFFPATFDREQLDLIDNNGIVKEGATVKKGDPLVVKMKKIEEDTVSKQLQNISRLLAQDYRDTSIIWDKAVSGTVAEVHVRKKDILVVVKTEEKSKIGDKLVGRYGNKGTITTILPDDEMPKDEEGREMHILLNPDGVPGRMNMGQILETTASKIVEKTGKPYIAKPFEGDYTERLTKELKQHKLKDHGTLKDQDGEIDGVLFGQQYFFKLEHQVDKKMSARSAGPGYSYTADGHPARGGGESGRSIGMHEMYALLSHGADANLKEMYTFKGDKQFEIWRAIENGTYVPAPDMPYSSKKFAEMLRGMGVNLEEESGNVKMVPFLDRDVAKISNGAIEDATALRAKDLKEESGGLFDLDTTGGLIGDKWSHIELVEPMPHPTFEKSILSVTGLRKKDFRDILSGKKGIAKGEVVDGKTPGATVGGKGIKELLNNINVDARIKEIAEEAPKKKGSALNKLHREARILKNFKDNKIKLEEMVVSKVPVIPPQYRPVIELPNGDISVADVNEHYRTAILMNNQLAEYEDRPGLRDEADKMRGELYKAMTGTMGFSEGLVDKPDVKGIASTIAGSNPKSGYYQSKLLKRRQDTSGTGVVGPDPDLNMDELGVPEEMAWEIFKPYIVKELKSMGFTSMKARGEIEKESKIAKDALLRVMEDRMVIANRAPTLHKFSIMAFKPKLVPGYAIKLPVEVLGAFNADFDGDTFGIHVPATKEATEEAKSMMASNNIYVPGSARGAMAPGLSKEYVVGIYKISRVVGKKNKRFKSAREAIRAAKNKEIEFTDEITISGLGNTTAGRAKLNSYLPRDMRDYKTDFDKSKIRELLDKTYKKHGKKEYLTAIEGWKHVGRNFVYTSGSSMLLSDLRSFTKEKNKLYEEADKEVDKIRKNKNLSKKEKEKRVIGVYMGVDKKISTRSMKLEDNDAGKSNNMSNMVHAGMSKPGVVQMKQIVGSVGMMTDHRQNIISEPVRGNYAEGLSSADFYSHMFSQRKGMIDKSRSVSGPGMLSKELTNTAARYKVTSADCGTTNGKDLPVDRHILDRVLAQTVSGGRQGDVIDNNTLEAIKKSGRKTVKVRSILSCEENAGMCAKCFGYDETGNFPHVGKNLGISQIQAITERSVQLPMKSFHTGGAVQEGQTSGNAFDRALEIFRMPQNIKNKATLSEVSGLVSSVRKSGYGGSIVTVGTREHKIPKNLDVVVKTGDRVKKGDKLSSGSIKHQELMKLKGVSAVQNQMTEDLHDAFASAGVKAQKKTFEVATKMYTEQVRIIDPGGSNEFVSGDYSTIPKVEAWNKKNPGKPQIKYMNILPGSLSSPQRTDDWSQRMALGRIKRTLRDGAGMGMSSDRKDGSPFSNLALGPGSRLKGPGEN